MSELIARLAGELGERVTVRVEIVGNGEGEIITLLPGNPAGAHGNGGARPRIAMTRRMSCGSQSPMMVASRLISRGWTRLGAVFAGRVKTVEGSGRYRVELELGDGDVRHGTLHSFIRELLPALGWQGRATVIQYEPY